MRYLPREPKVTLDALGGLDLRRDADSASEERSDRERRNRSPHAFPPSILSEVRTVGSGSGCSAIEAGKATAGPEKLAALVEHGLLDHLVRPQEQHLWDRQPECLRGLEVDDQREFGGPFDRNVARVGASQDFIDIAGGAVE